MKLKKEFADFYAAIRIDSETNALREKREALENDIRSKLPEILDEHGIDIQSSDIRMIDQGSYKYKTTVKDTVVDRDVAVMIPLSTAVHDDPRKIKCHLRDAITIPTRTVSFKEPCIRASYHRNGVEWMHIDLPLYALDGESVFLARGKEFSDQYAWEQSDPDGLNQYLCDRISGHDQLRRIICLIKKWRNEQYAGTDNDHEVPPSIGLTLLACDCFSPQSTSDGDDDLLALQGTMNEILKKFEVSKRADGEVISATIRRFLPVVPYTNVFQKMESYSASYMILFYKRLLKAVEDLTNAVNVESSHDAGIYVQRVLGNEFIVPAKEAVSATTQNRREHSFG